MRILPLNVGMRLFFEVIKYAEIIVMSPVVLGELYAGFEGGNKSAQNRIELQQFMESSRVKVNLIGPDTALFFSQIYSSLKRKGKPVPTNDMWIAAQALEHGCVICTNDKHFKEIEGLIVVNSTADLS